MKKAKELMVTQGGKPVSIKPSTYKSKMGLNEKIDVPIIFYDKKKDGIFIEFDFI